MVFTPIPSIGRLSLFMVWGSTMRHRDGVMLSPCNFIYTIGGIRTHDLSLVRGGALPTMPTNPSKVYVNDSESTTLVFTSDNWYKEVLLRVTAKDDEFEEGVDLLNFASQPSSLVRSIPSALLSRLPFARES